MWSAIHDADFTQPGKHDFAGKKYATAPFFSGTWLELGHLDAGYPKDANSYSQDDIRQMVRGYGAKGIKILVIAYAEFGGCFYYPSQINYTWPDYSLCTENQAQFYDCSADKPIKWMNPARNGGQQCASTNRFDVIGTIFDEAAKQGMHVVIGLGRSGDIFFANAMENYYEAIGKGRSTTIDVRTLTTRLSTTTTVATKVGEEIWQKYGHHESFYGWLLTYETTCYDVGRNYYDPIAKNLKNFSMPDKPVMAVPYSPRNCITPASTIPQHIRDSGIDIYFISDVIGARNSCGHLSGTAKLTCIAAGGEVQNRLQELAQYSRQIAQWHQGTGKHYWANVEIWRAPLDGPFNELKQPSGKWDAEVSFQLMHQGAYAQAFLFNEGLWYWNTGVPNFRIKDPTRRASAQDLAAKYYSYAASFIESLKPPASAPAPPASPTP